MTLNIFLFTITIKKRETSFEEVLHNERAKRHYEESKKNIPQYIRHF